MFKRQMRERTCCIPQRLLELLLFVLVRYSITTPWQCHKYHHPCTTANRTLVLLSVTVESPHGAASGCVLPLSCQHLPARGSSATCTSPFQRIEAKVAAAGLSHHTCPFLLLIRQASKDRAAVEVGIGLTHPGRGLWERELCQCSWCSTSSVCVGWRLLAPVESTWEQISAPRKTGQLGSRGTFHSFSSTDDAQLQNT